MENGLLDTFTCTTEVGVLRAIFLGVPEGGCVSLGLGSLAVALLLFAVAVTGLQWVARRLIYGSPDSFRATRRSRSDPEHAREGQSPPRRARRALGPRRGSFRRLPHLFRPGLAPQLPDQFQFGLEVDVMRQLDVFEKPVAWMLSAWESTNSSSCAGAPALSSPSSSQRSARSTSAHRDRLALGLAEDQPVAAGELRRFGLRAGELVDRLAFGQRDLADLDREPSSGISISTGTRPMRSSPTKAWVRP
jgi:hypothetical protein